MKYKRTENEQENKKQEIKKWQPVCISKNGGHRSQGDLISFISMADAPYHCPKSAQNNERRCNPRKS
jgi:hypothetical protein